MTTVLFSHQTTQGKSSKSNCSNYFRNQMHLWISRRNQPRGDVEAEGIILRWKKREKTRFMLRRRTTMSGGKLI